MNNISALIAVSAGEEQLLDGCVKSVEDFVDEIVIFSLGASVELKDKKIRVIVKPPAEYVEPLRNEMVSACKNEWIILLDPDERVSPGLKEILISVKNENKVDIVNIPRKNVFFGKWISHTNWWPDRQYRFFRKGSLVWSGEIHLYPQVKGKTLNLKAEEKISIEHLGYKDLSQFIDRQIRYSRVAAENIIKEGKSFSFFNLFYFPARNFVTRYIKHTGFLDGFYGFSLSFLTSMFEFAVWINVWHLKQK